MKIRIGKLSPDVTDEEILTGTVPDSKLGYLKLFHIDSSLNFPGIDNDGENSKILHKWITENKLGSYVSSQDFWILLAIDHFGGYCASRFKDATVKRMRYTSAKRQALSRLYWGADAVVINSEDLLAGNGWAGVLSDSNLSAEDPYRFCNVLFELQETYESTVGGRGFGRDKRMLLSFLNGLDAFKSRTNKKVNGDLVKAFAKKIVFLLSGRSISALEWNRIKMIIEFTMERLVDEKLLKKVTRSTENEKTTRKSMFPLVGAGMSDDNLHSVKKNDENVSSKRLGFVTRRKGEK